MARSLETATIKAQTAPEAVSAHEAELAARRAAIARRSPSVLDQSMAAIARKEMEDLARDMAGDIPAEDRLELN